MQPADRRGRAGAGTKVKIHTEYDDLGNVVSTKDELDQVRTTTYDAVGLYPLVEANALGHQVITAVDYRWGVPLAVFDPNLSLTLYAYDAAGRLRCLARAGDSVTNCTQASSTAATERYTYYFASGAADYSSVTVERREPNHSTGYVAATQYFDALGRQRYTTSQRVVNCANDETVVVSGDTVYNAAGRVARTYDPYPAPFGTRSNGVTLYDYRLGGGAFQDPFGRPYQVTKPNNGSSGAGRSTSMFYDRGRATVIDPEGHKTVSVSDTYGRTVRQETYNGTTLYAWTVTTYDGAGRVLTTTMNDNANTQMRHTYDLLGRKTQTVDPDSGTWTYRYDAAGNLVFQDDPKPNQHIQYCYDVLNRPVQKDTFADDSTVHPCTGAAEITYIYDQTSYMATPGASAVVNKGKGRLTSVVDASGERRSRYDIRGRVIGSSQRIEVDGVETWAVFTTVYDAADRPWKTTYPDGEVTESVYDATGQPRQLHTTIGGTLTPIVNQACSDFLGRPLSIARANSVADLFEYHGPAGSAAFAEGHALQRITIKKGTAPPYLDLQYQDYDQRGMLKTVVDPDGSVRSNSAAYSYDFAGRLAAISGAASPVESAFAYDALGNMRIKGAREFFYDTPAKPHQMTGIRVAGGALNPVLHDGNGNRLYKPPGAAPEPYQQYTFDRDDRLATTAVDGRVLTFTYNAQGQQTVRQVAGGPPLTMRYYAGGLIETVDDGGATGSTTRHYYLGGQRVASRTTNDTTWELAGRADGPIRFAQVDMDRPAVVLHLGPNAQALAVVGIVVLGTIVLLPLHRRRSEPHGRVSRGQALGGSLVWILATLPWPLILAAAPAGATLTESWRHYHYDHLGSVQVVTDATGLNVENLRYQPYGGVRGRWNQSGNSLTVAAGQPRYEFTGYETETISGLEYAGARFYDPALGSFLTHDPARQFANPYTYTNWNPTNHTDPSGQWVEAVIAALLVGGVLAAVGSAIDAGIRTGDASQAIGAFGTSLFFSLYSLAAGAVILAPLSAAPAAFQNAVALASAGYGVVGTAESFRTGNYATGAVSVMALAYGLYGLLAQGANYGIADPAANPTQGEYVGDAALAGQITPQGQGGSQAAPAFMNDPDVASELNAAWAQSNPNAPTVARGQPGSLKVEQGGWIRANRFTGARHVIRVPAGTRDSLPTILGTRPRWSLVYKLEGWFHTHPNTFAEGYGYLPSPGDIAFTTQYGQVPGVVKTHHGDQFIPYP
ncbi:MAG: RHS repeat-associated core domain-containing protein [Candidatus Binatia bacterium]